MVPEWRIDNRIFKIVITWAYFQFEQSKENPTQVNLDQLRPTS